VWSWLVARRWALGLLAWAALAVTIAWFEIDENEQLNGAPTAPAVITGTDHWVKGGPELLLRIELPDGRTLESSTTNFYDYPPRQVGARIEVQYAVDGQDVWCREAGIGPSHGFWGWLIAGAGAAVAGIVMLVVAGRRSRRPRLDQ
jgi:hypothetical protein